MKKIFLLVLAIPFFSAAQEAKSVQNMKLTVAFEKSASDTLKLRGNRGFQHLLFKNSKGIFTTELSVSEGLHQLTDGKLATLVFLKNGFDLEVNINPDAKDKIFTYNGLGADENNYLIERSLKDEAFEKSAFEKDKETFTKLVESYKKECADALNSPKFDSGFIKQMTLMNTQYFQYLGMMYDEAQISKKLIGNPSPTFNYENHKGGKTSLEELKGKVVYIDVWATWCGPCRAEIPSLKKLEEKFHGKDIAFVSISVDTQKDYEKWKKFVVENNLGGIQLFADNDWKSQFVKDYSIQGIPRFIILDKKGNVVQANAPRPSSNEIFDILNKLL